VGAFAFTFMRAGEGAFVFGFRRAGGGMDCSQIAFSQTKLSGKLLQLWIAKRRLFMCRNLSKSVRQGGLLLFADFRNPDAKPFSFSFLGRLQRLLRSLPLGSSRFYRRPSSFYMIAAQLRLLAPFVLRICIAFDFLFDFDQIIFVLLGSQCLQLFCGQ